MNEEALFSKHRIGRLRDCNLKKSNKDDKTNSEEDRNERKWKSQSWCSRGAQKRRNQQDTQDRRYHQRDVECYNCGKRGHYARDCQYRRAKGNIVTSIQPQVQSEEEWDFDIQTSYAIKEQVKNGSNEFVEACDSENE